MPDPSPSTLTVLNYNFLQLGKGVVADHSGEFTPVNCETHCVSRHQTHNLPIVSPTQGYRDLVHKGLMYLFSSSPTYCIT